jgi:hypothetical protein
MGPPGVPESYIRKYGGYDEPIELPAIEGTGASQSKTLINVTMPEIEEGWYFMTARIGVAGPYASAVVCTSDGGFEDAVAGAFGDRQIARLSSPDQPPSDPNVKLQSVLLMRDDWTPIQLRCQATGLADGESARIMEYHFALVRIG